MRAISIAPIKATGITLGETCIEGRTQAPPVNMGREEVVAIHAAWKWSMVDSERNAPRVPNGDIVATCNIIGWLQHDPHDGKLRQIHRFAITGARGFVSVGADSEEAAKMRHDNGWRRLSPGAGGSDSPGACSAIALAEQISRWWSGRFGWLLANVRVLAEPVPACGALGVWSLSADVERMVRDQTEAAQ